MMPQVLFRSGLFGDLDEMIVFACNVSNKERAAVRISNSTVPVEFSGRASSNNDEMMGGFLR